MKRHNKWERDRKKEEKRENDTNKRMTEKRKERQGVEVIEREKKSERKRKLKETITSV